MTPFQNPLTIDDLRQFTHPRPDHVFHVPFLWQDGLAACNGHMLILASRGLWLEKEHPEPAGEALERLQKIHIPDYTAPPADSWVSLGDHSYDILRKPSPKPIWSDNHKLRYSPLWLIAGEFLARLSFLQIIARLPRAEICLHLIRAQSPLPFRYTGGRGLLAPVPYTKGHHIPDYRFLNPKSQTLI